MTTETTEPAPTTRKRVKGWTERLQEIHGEESDILLVHPSFTFVQAAGGRYLSLWHGIRERDLANHVEHALTRNHQRAFAMSCQHRYPVEALARHFYVLSAHFEHHIVNGADELMEILAAEAAKLEASFAERLNADSIDFGDIPLLFKKDMEVCERESSGIAGIIKEVEFQKSFFGVYWQIKVEVVHLLQGTPAIGTTSIYVGDFKSGTSINQLPLMRMTPERKAALMGRGQVLQRVAGGENYVSYKGDLVQKSYYGDRNYRADGRVIIDGPSFQRMDADGYRMNLRSLGLEIEDDEDERKGLKDVSAIDPAVDGWRTFPSVPAFSLATKKWGLIDLDKVTPINWRTEAFDTLVLPDDEKQMVRALVEHHGGSFEDIVEGKGGGCIFLLHGAPGQGKTLTAEAVAELLKRPLYSVSVGELGTDPKQLEASLRQILDVATTWNAVLLLDEADIFLEERDEKDILRNAMVGVFLRLLEYHQGVLFLTTNRVRNIDQAFYSRISVALKFGDATDEKRTAIWKNLLKAADLKGIDPVEMGRIPLNGRQIKNAIRLAQTLARAEGQTVTSDRLRRVVGMAQNFQAEMAAR